MVLNGPFLHKKCFHGQIQSMSKQVRESLEDAVAGYYPVGKGRLSSPEWMNFRKTSKRPVTPPPLDWLTNRQICRQPGTSRSFRCLDWDKIVGNLVFSWGVTILGKLHANHCFAAAVRWRSNNKNQDWRSGIEDRVSRIMIEDWGLRIEDRGSLSSRHKPMIFAGIIAWNTQTKMTI